MQKFNNETEFVFSNEFIGFTTIPNHILNDKCISYKALGLYVQILQFQNSPTHKIYIKSLSQLKKDGRDSVSSGVKELLKAGYLNRELLQDELGRMNGYRYTVYMKPQKALEIRIPSENGLSENGPGDTGLSDVGEPATNNTIGKKKIINKVNQSVKKTEGPTDFNKLKAQIEEQVDIETLQQEGQDPDFLEELILNICDMHEADFVMVAGSKLPQARVRANIARLKHYHLEHVIRQYNETSVTTPIRNVKGYLQTCIYNSVLESTAKINNEIRAKGLVGY